MRHLISLAKKKNSEKTTPTLLPLLKKKKQPKSNCICVSIFSPSYCTSGSWYHGHLAPSLLIIFLLTSTILPFFFAYFLVLYSFYLSSAGPPLILVVPCICPCVLSVRGISHCHLRSRSECFQLFGQCLQSGAM